jgi:hypothetical protein
VDKTAHDEIYSLGERLGITREEIDALIEEISNYGISKQVSVELGKNSIIKVLKMMEEK